MSDFDKRFKKLLRVASREDLEVMLAVLLCKQAATKKGDKP